MKFNWEKLSLISSMKSRRTFPIVFLAIFLVTGNFSPEAFASDFEHPSGTFEIDVLPISTSLGTPTINLNEAQNTVASISQIYSALSDGKVKFVLRKILPGVSSVGPILAVTDTLKYVPADNPPVDAGFAGLIVVEVIPKNPSILFSGESYGSDVLLNDFFDLNSTNTLAHEIGHSFGLDHSSSGSCSIANLLWTCTADEYGDNSDFMGSYLLGKAMQQGATIERLSASQLDNLGFLDKQQIAYADASLTTVLSPVYSTSAGGTRLLYIPIDNQDGYSVEFRPATGLEVALSQNQIDVWGGGGSYYSSVPSYGVQVRLLAGISPLFKKEMPAVSYPSVTGPSADGNEIFSGRKSAVLTLQNSVQQGLNTGESMILFDGTVINVDSEDGTLGAKIEVIRPAVTSGPTLDGSTVSATIQTEKNLDGTYSVNKSSIDSYSWPAITIGSQIPSDPIRLTSAQITLNGNIVATVDPITLFNSPMSSAVPLSLTVTPHSLGINKFQLITTDSIGRSLTSDIGQFDLQPYRYPSIDSANLQVDSITFSSARILAAQCTNLPDTVLTLTLIGLSDGTVSTIPDTGCKWTSFNLSGLKSSKTYALSIGQTDSFGQTGLSSPVTFTTLNAPPAVPKKKVIKSSKKPKKAVRH